MIEGHPQIAQEVIDRIQQAVRKSRQILFNASHVFEIVTRLIVGLIDKSKVTFKY
jgi:hypothetical protein